MATERIDIIVREDGSRVVKRNLEEIGQAGTKASGGLRELRGLLATIGAGAGLNYLRQQADAYQNIINKLKLVTDSSANLAAVNDRLFATAQRTRTAYTAVADLYAKVAMNADRLGMSQEAILGLTETISMATQISGVAAETGANSIRQLLQGLGKGRLDGDELRSVLENNLRLAKAIADGLGVSVGQLRQMGKEGKLTAQEVVSALQEQAPKIAEEFARMTPTIGSAFTVFGNAMTKFIGETFVATGIAEGLARGIIFLADNIETLAAITATAGVAAIAVYFGQISGAVAVATRAVWAFTAALAANPIGLVAVAIAAALTALVAFGDEVNVIQDDLSTLGDESINLHDLFGAAMSLMKDAAGDAYGWIVDHWYMMIEWINEGNHEWLDVTLDVLNGILAGAKATANFIIGAFVFCVRAIGNLWEGLVPALGDIGIRAVNGLISIIESGINRAAAIVLGGPFAPFIEGAMAATGLRIEIGRLDNPNAGAAAALDSNMLSDLEESFSTDYLTNGFNLMREVGTDALNALIERAQELKAAREAAAGSVGSDAGIGEAIEDGKDGKGSKKETRAEMMARFNRETDQAISQARELSEERRILADLDKMDEELRRRRYEAMSGPERAAMADKLRLMYEEEEIMRVRDDLYQRFSGPAREYERHLTAAAQLLERGSISAEDYARAIRDARIEYLQTKTDAASGLELGALRVGASAEDGGAERTARAYESQWLAANGATLDLLANLTAVQQLMANDPINSGQYGDEMVRLGAEALNLRLQLGDATFFDALRAGLGSLVADYQGMLQGLGSAFGDFFSRLGDGFANSVGRALVYSEDLGAALLDVARSAVSELISSLVKLGIQWLITKTLSAGMQAAQTALAMGSMAAITAASVAAGAATAVAWAPAAAAVSLATAGANSVPAIAGITAAYGTAKAMSLLGAIGLKDGGAVDGPGGPRDDAVPAWLSAGEFVVNAAATNRYRSLLEDINSGRSIQWSAYAMGGESPGSIPAQVGAYSVASGGDSYTFNVTVEGDTGEGEKKSVEERVRDVLSEEAPKMVSAARQLAHKDTMDTLTRQRL